MRSILIIAAIILFSFTVQLRAGIEGVEDHEKSIRNCFRSGDDLKYYVEIKELLSQHPLHPLSVLHYQEFVQMAEIFGPERISEDIRRIIDSVKKSGDAHAGSCLLKLRLGLESLMYRINPDKGKKETESLSPIREWFVAGPFYRYGPGDLEYPFEPEVLYGKKEGAVGKKIRITDYDGGLDLSRYLYPARGAAYASVSFRHRGAARIHVYSGSCYKVFINGKAAARNLSGDVRNHRIIEVGNSSGVTIILKVLNSQSDRVRVILTDGQDAVINPVFDRNKVYNDDCEISEMMDYPGEELIRESQRNPVKGKGYLGEFYENLGSAIAAEYYRAAASLNGDQYNLYWYASYLLNVHESEINASWISEGSRIIREIARQDPGFVPAAISLMKMHVSSHEFELANQEGLGILSHTSRSHHAAMELLNLYRYPGFEGKFEAHASIAKNLFPLSTHLLRVEAEFLQSRDSVRYLDVLQKSLAVNFSITSARQLINAMMNRGDFKSAADIIGRYNYNSSFNKELVDVFIGKREYPVARKIIFRELLTSSDPFYYRALARIDLLEQDDPEMYLHKLIALDPSDYDAADHAEYIASGRLTNPLIRQRKKNPDITKEFFGTGESGASSTAVYRGRVFQLLPGGSFRVFCEEIIRVHDDKGVARWKKIRIPWAGRFQPVRIRVYEAPGSFSSSYSLRYDGGHGCVSFDSLKKNSVIHLSYIVEAAAQDSRKSGFITIPAEYIQIFREPVRIFSLAVIAPKECTVRFFLNDNQSVSESRFENSKLYSLILKNMPASDRESCAGDAMNNHNFYAISSMEDEDDFVNWYQGMLVGKTTLPASFSPDSLKGGTIEKTIANVYEFVSRGIKLSDESQYHPEDLADILGRKRGSAENKSLLARAILQRLGIAAYLSFARDTYLPDPGGFVSPDNFTSTLLYVPLDMNDSRWLDFSNSYFRCGNVADSLAGSRGLVILHRGYQKKIITGEGNRDVIRTLNITLSGEGDARCAASLTLADPSGEMRKMLSDPLFREESIRRYFGKQAASFRIDDVAIENLEDYNKPIILSACGNVAGVTLSDEQGLILLPMTWKNAAYDYIQIRERTQPLVIARHVSERDTTTYVLPEEFRDVEVMKSHNVNSKYGKVTVSVLKTKGSNILKLDKTFFLNPAVIKPAGYPELLKFLLDLKRIENEAIVIKKSK